MQSRQEFLEVPGDVIPRASYPLIVFCSPWPCCGAQLGGVPGLGQGWGLWLLLSLGWWPLLGWQRPLPLAQSAPSPVLPAWGTARDVGSQDSAFLSLWNAVGVYNSFSCKMST